MMRRLHLFALGAVLALSGAMAVGSTQPPAPWTSADIGVVGKAGASNYEKGAFTIDAGGLDIWGAADGFRLVSQPVTGDVTIVARVLSLTNTDTFAKAGVMLRDSVAANSADVILDVKPDGGVEFMTRQSAGGETLYVAGATPPVPTWLRLARVSNQVTAAVSANGSTWTTVGVITVTTPTRAVAGLAVTSHRIDRLNRARFDHVTVTKATPAPAPPPPPVGTRTILIPAGGDLQASIDGANPGDTLVLQPGVTYTGNFVLPNKPGAGFVTIQSAAVSTLPTGRMDPSFAAQLPKIRSGNSDPALVTRPGAHHYRLVGLELQANAQGYGDIVDLGSGDTDQNTLASVPHDLVLDRLYVHGDPLVGQKRGIGLNSASTTIQNSYIADIKAIGQDSQAIGGWNGPGPFTITNNYLEAAGENFMLGGSDPAIPNLVPSDVVVRGNTFAKPLSWRASPWSVKNLFELKNAQRVTVDGNMFEFNWQAGQNGYAIAVTPRNQGGTAPWSVVQQVTFTNNVIRHVASGFNILGVDDEHQSQRTNAITIRNNLLEDVSATAYGGDGRFMILGGGATITIDHNTVLNDGLTTVYVYGTQVPGFVFTNNIISEQGYGAFFGDAVLGRGLGTLSVYFPSYTFAGNLIVHAAAALYPPRNQFPADVASVGFIDPATSNYRLGPTSLYRGLATDGADPGCNLDALFAALRAYSLK